MSMLGNKQVEGFYCDAYAFLVQSLLNRLVCVPLLLEKDYPLSGWYV